MIVHEIPVGIGVADTGGVFSGAGIGTDVDVPAPGEELAHPRYRKAVRRASFSG